MNPNDTTNAILGSRRKRLAVIVGGAFIGIGIAGAASALLNDTGTYSVETTDDEAVVVAQIPGGARVSYIGDGATTAEGASGSGTFDSFVRLGGDEGDTGTLSGYNTDGTREFQTKGGSFTRSIKLSDIPTVTVGGATYWEFFADINETDSTPKISLDKVEVYLTANKNITGYPFPTTGTNAATPVYTFDGAIKINDINSGSGRGDLRYLIPVQPEAPANCNFGNAACTTYVVLYSKWGGLGGDYVAEGGFEEWKVKVYPKLTVTKTINGTYDTPVDWTITKTEDATYNKFRGDATVNHPYVVSVDRTDGAARNTAISGTITVVGDKSDPVTFSLTDSFAGQSVTIGTCTSAGNTIAPVAGKYTLPKNTSMSCTYSKSLTTPTTGTNTATATIQLDNQTIVFTGTESIEAAQYTQIFTGEPTNITVVDNVGTVSTADDRTWTTGVDASWNYPSPYTCPTASGSYTNGVYSTTVVNTASIQGVDGSDNSDTATVTLNCYTPTINKTATATYDERHTWDITKSVTPPSQDAFAGETVNLDWDVNVTHDQSDENFDYAGTVTVVNPNPVTDLVVTLSDSINGTPVVFDDTTCTITAANVLTVPKGTTANCSYSLLNQDPGTIAQAPTTNTASFVLNTFTYSDQENIAYTVNRINPTLTINDSTAPFDGNEITDDFDPPAYTGTYTCSTTAGDYTSGEDLNNQVSNTATLTSGQTLIDSASATTVVDCFRPSVDKTALGRYDETHTWTVTKSVNPPSQSGFFGEEVDFDWTIAVDETVTDGNFDTNGVITVVNPHDTASLIVTLADTLSNGTAVTITGDTGCSLAAGNVLTVAANSTANCSYAANDLTVTKDSKPTSNTVSFSLFGQTYSKQQSITWSTTIINPSVTLNDPGLPTPIVNQTISDDWTQNFDDGYTCSSTAADYTNGRDLNNQETNTATITLTVGPPQSSTAVATIDCYRLGIAKTVTPSFTRTYDYDIEKKPIDPGDGTLTLNNGQSHIIEWQIDLVDLPYSAAWDSAWAIDTSVTVANPAPIAASSVSIADGLDFVDLTCTGWKDGEVGVVPANGSVSCSSDDDSTTTAVTTNTATVSKGLIQHASSTATWNWNTPTTEVNKTVDVEDFFQGIEVTGDLQPPASGTYTYGTGGKTWTVMTTVSNDPADDPDHLLTCGPDQIVTNTASVIGDDGQPLDADTATVTIDVECGTACTLTQGYWKTHSAAGPKGNHDTYIYTSTDTWWKMRDDTWDYVGPETGSSNPDLNEETIFFKSGQTYWQVQWTAPQGNAYYNLAHQWIATQLNIWQEADEGFGGDWAGAFASAPAEVRQAYTTAFNWFMAKTPADTPRGKAANELRSAASILAAFNEGKYPGWPHCDENTQATLERYFALNG